MNHHEKLKQQIVNESWKIIDQEGWQSLSIRKIAHAIGYSIPVVYKYFKDKDELVLYFSQKGFEKLASQLQKAIADTDDESQWIGVLADTYWNFAFSNRKYYEIMFGLGIPTCERINSMSEMRNTSLIFEKTIKTILTKHKNEHIDVHLKLKTFWSILHGLVAIELLTNTAENVNPSAVLVDAINGFTLSLTT